MFSPDIERQRHAAYPLHCAPNINYDFHLLTWYWPPASYCRPSALVNDHTISIMIMFVFSPDIERQPYAVDLLCKFSADIKIMMLFIFSLDIERQFHAVYFLHFCIRYQSWRHVLYLCLFTQLQSWYSSSHLILSTGATPWTFCTCSPDINHDVVLLLTWHWAPAPCFVPSALVQPISIMMFIFSPLTWYWAPAPPCC